MTIGGSIFLLLIIIMIVAVLYNKIRTAKQQADLDTYILNTYVAEQDDGSTDTSVNVTPECQAAIDNAVPTTLSEQSLSEMAHSESTYTVPTECQIISTTLDDDSQPDIIPNYAPATGTGTDSLKIDTGLSAGQYKTSGTNIPDVTDTSCGQAVYAAYNMSYEYATEGFSSKTSSKDIVDRDNYCPGRRRRCGYVVGPREAYGSKTLFDKPSSNDKNLQTMVMLD